MTTDPIAAPKRLGAERRRHPDEDDPTAMRTLAGFTLLILLGIGVAQFGQELGWFEAEQASGLDNLFGEGGAGLPARQMETGELIKADALPQESFGKTVTVANESDTCSSLRNDLAYAKRMVSRASGAPGPKLDELKRELGRIQSQGTRMGCWSGGPQ